MSSEQLHAVLVALEGDTLLLPNSAVLEVVSREAIEPIPSAPPWLLGQVAWSGLPVPVIRLEGLNGEDAVTDGRRARIVVLQSLGQRWPMARFAVLAQGYPHLVTLNRAAMAPMKLRDTDRPDLVLARVRIASQETWVPDLETVEAQLARALPGV